MGLKSVSYRTEEKKIVILIKKKIPKWSQRDKRRYKDCVKHRPWNEKFHIRLFLVLEGTWREKGKEFRENNHVETVSFEN